MKEPNSEQTPSASDEQKPNIEGKQVSDGADDTTSPDDRSSNEDGATCNKEEDDLLLTSAINKLGGNKRAGYRNCCDSCRHLLLTHAVSSNVLHPQTLDQCKLYKPSHL